MLFPISFLKNVQSKWKPIFKNLKKNLIRLKFLESNFANDLQQQYSSLIHNKDRRRDLRMKEKKISSQHGEDGLILHFLDQIGAKNHIAAEFGVGGGQECNTANLIINFGWNALLIEGNKKNYQQAKSYFASHPLVDERQVTILNQFVDADNINSLLEDNLSVKDIDLLSLDIDGNDYWVWKAITSIEPRLVVIEYNSSLGKNCSVTVKYDSRFNRFKKHSSGFYHGATLKALTKLARNKGYGLVGCESHGINAFFIRNDLVQKHQVDVLSPEKAFYANQKRGEKMTISEQRALTEHLEFVEV